MEANIVDLDLFQSPSSILITLMGSLGDVARGLSLVSPLKHKFKSAKITWLVEPKCAELVSFHPQIDKVIIFERTKGLPALFKLWQKLREENFDLCLDLQRHFKSALFSRMSGASRIIGFDRSNAKEFNWIFSHERIPACPETLPKIEHYWKFLEHLGISAPSTPEINLRLDSLEQVFKKLSIEMTNSYVVLVLGSSWESKDWPISGYQKFIDQLSKLKPNLRFILTGGKEHVAMGQELKIAAGKSEGQIINLCGRSSLADLCVVVKHAKAVAGPDSGPGHLASIFMVPFIGLFGPTDATRTAPYGPNVSIISARIGCSPCYRRSCPGLNKLCMRMIEPVEVVEAVLTAI